MGRNALDFVGHGNVTGQVAEVRLHPSREHIGIRDGHDDDGNLVAVEYAYALPGVEATIRLHGHPFVYGVRVVAGEHGPRLAELLIEQPAGEPDVPITPTDIRVLAKLLDRLAFAAVDGVAAVESPAFHRPELKRPGRRGHGEAFYAEIAEYARQVHRARASHQTVMSVREAIALHYNVSRDSADKWLARARRAGLLQAGELGGKPKPQKQTNITKKRQQK